MPTIKVDELDGDLLDRAVAMVSGVQVEFSPAAGYWRIAGDPDGARWEPRQDANQAVDLIFAENIALLPPGFPDLFEKGWTACVDPGVDGDGDFAYGYDSNHKPLLSTGPTPLVAGLRCWLLLKVGETVELDG